MGSTETSLGMRKLANPDRLCGRLLSLEDLRQLGRLLLGLLSMNEAKVPMPSRLPQTAKALEGPMCGACL